MMVYCFCKGPKEKIGKWADHLCMDVDHVRVAQWTSVVEVLNIITPGPPDTIFQGALDE